MSGEESLRPDLDGTGGGYGKFKGITVRELSELFDRVAADGNMRSVTAVLRITYEQLEARGGLGYFPHICIGTGVFAVACGIPIPFVSLQTQGVLIKMSLGSAFVCLAFLFGVLKNRHQTMAAIAQERAIRDLALDALVRIVTEPGFKPKPLDREHVKTLLEVQKKAKRYPPELSVLNQHP